MDTGVENVAIDRAKYILTWMTVGADQDDFRAPKGDKTFEGSVSCSNATILVGQVSHYARCTQDIQVEICISCTWRTPLSQAFGPRFCVLRLAYSRPNATNALGTNNSKLAVTLCLATCPRP